MAPRRSKRPPRRPKWPPRGFPRGPEEAKIIDFSMVFEGFYCSRLFGQTTTQNGPRGSTNRPKTAPEAPQRAPKRPKRAPRRTQRSPRRPKRAPRRPQESPKRAPRGSQEAPTRAPRWPNASKTLQDGPRQPKRAPRQPKRAPKGPQKGSRKTPKRQISLIFILLLKVFRVLAFSGQERTCHEPSRASLRDRSFRFRAGPGDGKSEVRASDVEQGAKPFLGGVQRAIGAGPESLMALLPPHRATKTTQIVKFTW